MYNYDEKNAMATDQAYYEQQQQRAMGGVDYEPGSWPTFAGLMIGLTGLWNGFEGIVALFRSSYFIGTPVYGSLAFWSFVWIGFGLLQLVAAGAILAGQSWGRWFGVVVAGISALINMFMLPAYPWWSLFVLAIDVIILYGLLVHWRSAPKMMTAG